MKKYIWWLVILMSFILAAPMSYGSEGKKNSLKNVPEMVTVYDPLPWNQHKKEYKLRDEKRIKKLVIELFDLKSPDSIYHRAGVQVEEDHIIVDLLRKDTYTADTVRVDLDTDFNVISVTHDYIRAEPDQQESAAAREYAMTYAICPDCNVEVVVSTCETGIPTAVAAVNEIYDEADDDGYYTVKLLGSQENVANIQNYLSCPNLKFWGRVGHGSYDRLVLSNGNLTHTYLDSLPGNALNDTVVYANSCLAHNPPFEPAMISTGVQKFIAGDIELLIGPSENVFKCWSDSVITNDLTITSSLYSCEASHYPYTGAHGISGTGSDLLEDPGLSCEDSCECEFDQCYSEFGIQSCYAICHTVPGLCYYCDLLYEICQDQYQYCMSQCP